MNQAKAQASNTQPVQGRRVIAVHLILTLYGHWAVNDSPGIGIARFPRRQIRTTGTDSLRKKIRFGSTDAQRAQAVSRSARRALKFSPALDRPREARSNRRSDR